MITRTTVYTLALLVLVAAVFATAFVWSGVYDIGADDEHTPPVYAALEALRERSIETRADKLTAPANLSEPARIRQGAGNYAAMCTGCHLAPGAPETELSKGLYPKPPNLVIHHVDPKEAFWVIKHGVKASGMPAWGRSMEDEYIWNMVAFLQTLPTLDRAAYDSLVASSGGHSHGGGETDGHSHAEGAKDHAQDEAVAADHHAEPAVERKPAAGNVHVHADGKRHVHANATPTPTPPARVPAPTAEQAPAAAEHDDHDHDHQH